MDWYLQIRAASDADRPADAIELGKGAIAASAADFRTLMLFGMELQALARYGDALEAFQQAETLASYEEQILVYRQRGLLEQARANAPRALEWFELSVAAATDDATGHVYLGALLSKLGEFERAAFALRRGTECTRGAVDEAWLNLGYVLRAQEKYSDALQCFQQALSLDPDYSLAAAAIVDLEHVLLRARDA
jgi:tetratricopeptide (TPR) repeat protein